LVSDAVALSLIILESVHWVRDGPKIAYKVDGCDAYYMPKYNLVQHLWAHYNVVMESNKPECPSIQKEGLNIKITWPSTHQVLSNHLAWFYHNDQKAIARPWRHVNLKWDRLWVALWDTPKVTKPTLIKLASSHIFRFLGMITWGVGSIFLNMQAKVKCNKDFIIVI